MPRDKHTDMTKPLAANLFASKGWVVDARMAKPYGHLLNSRWTHLKESFQVHHLLFLIYYAMLRGVATFVCHIRGDNQIFVVSTSSEEDHFFRTATLFP